jgi:NAD/NADP transhydrogenase alpha subunit
MDSGFILWTVMMFVLAAFVGHHVIHGVPTLLHTPLMSATNAISAISVVGAIVVAGSEYEPCAPSSASPRWPRPCATWWAASSSPSAC